MHGPEYRTPAPLAEQNDGEPWTDCNERRRPRAHAWRLDFETVDGARTYYHCRRCPVSTFTDGRLPAGYLGGRSASLRPLLDSVIGRRGV